jgi:hypothetical protein
VDAAAGSQALLRAALPNGNTSWWHRLVSNTFDVSLI